MNHSILNLIAAIVLSVIIILGWQHFYERPRMARLVESALDNKHTESVAQAVSNNTLFTRDEALNLVKRVKITSSVLAGSINLTGLRFDDLILLEYKQDLSPDSKCVELFSPANSKKAYFVEFGWYSNDSQADLPDVNTKWQTDSELLSPQTEVNLSWTNKHGVKFLVNVSLDDNYLFTIKQIVVNNSINPLTIQPYGLINHNYHVKEKLVNILHQGPIGVIDEQLQEYSYDDVKDKKIAKFAATKVDWLGITDKYWLAAVIPDKQNNYSANFSYAPQGDFEKFQVDFIMPLKVMAPHEELITTNRLFAGAKKVKLLDRYKKQLAIKLFDRAIDFGWFYILTKPVFNTMSFFYNYVGNFGISILIVTVMIKLLLFTLANKSYRAMKKMKNLHPEIERVKALYGKDKGRLNQEIIQLYRREKVNPISGCLPLLIQIPVFFSIYKVLYVTIEMRHAPFFGWIKDLSSPDPTTIFNLFGLIAYTPPQFLMIGAWPIFMALTMFLQQQLGPQPADPTQAQVMKFMPLIFLVMFSSFPAGLLIYWSWNNILSIIQQYYINKMDHAGVK